MSRLRYWPLIGVLGLLAAAPREDRPDEAANLERNRRLLARWREDPEHYARLRRDLEAFAELPPERQERLRRLDRDLHQLDPATRSRLWTALERYALWLEHLPPADRHLIEGAADPGERLGLIREVRQRQWLERLPRRVREEVLALPEPRRAERIAQLRKEEQRQRRDWQKPLRPRTEPRAQHPQRLDQFAKEVEDFVRKTLMPKLTAPERARLDNADGGKWPQLARTLLDLAERHLSLPPLPEGPITRYEQLPARAKVLLPMLDLHKTGKWNELKKHEGAWPDYGLAFVALLGPQQKPLAPPLGASRPEELPPAARAFVEKRLLPELIQEDRTRLRRLEGRWPDYPRLLLQLAREHGLPIPGLMLPGPQDIWDAARN